MQKFLIAALLGFFVFTTTFAQTPAATGLRKGFAIQGIVADSLTQEALPYITAALLEPGQVQAIRTVTTGENGSFSFTQLAEKPYQLILAFHGYKTRIISILPQPGALLDLGRISLSPTAVQLEQVQIVAQRALIEQDLDKLSYHVEADPESNTLSALEMMRKVPMLSLDGTNNLLLNGSSSYQVLINGKPSSLFVDDPAEVLQTMPASTIKRIEILTTPPARFEADGVGGVINIITYRETISGYNGSLNASGNNPYGYAAGSGLHAKTGKFGFSGNFSNKITSNPATSSIFERRDLISQSKLVQQGTGNNNNENLNVSGELGFDLDAHSQISVNYRQHRNLNSNDFEQLVTLLDAQNTQTQAYKNLNSGKTSTNGKDLGLDYRLGSKKRREQVLTASYKLMESSRETNAAFTLQPLLNYTRQENLTENNSSTREHTFQADYVQPIKKQTLELGVRSSLRDNRNHYFYKKLNPETGNFELVSRFSNNFDYSQDIHAAYLSVTLRKNKFGVRAGSRLEETTVKANFHSSETVAAQHYYNLTPNVLVSYQLNKDNTLKGSYAQRLERPGLYQLNPYVNQIDPNNISYGNPDLAPAINQIITLAYNSIINRSAINVDLTHTFTNNGIQRFTTLGPDRVARTTYSNIGESRNYILSLGASTTVFKKLSLNLNNSGTYTRMTSNVNGNSQNNAGVSLNVSGNASYRLNKGWRLNANAGLNTPRILLQGKSSAFAWNGFTVNKEILKNKGNLTLSVTNPFRKYRTFSDETITEEFYQFQGFDSIIRQYSLAFNYRFSKVQGNGPRKRRAKKTE